MKFEQITLSSHNANHQYLICGEGRIVSTSNDRLRLVVSLDEEINLSDKLCSVEILGVEYDCSNLELNRNAIVGEIERISSHMYTKQLKR